MRICCWAYLLFTQLRYMVRKKNSSSIFNLLHPWFLLSQLPRSKSNFSLPSMLNDVKEKEHSSSQSHSQTQCHLIFFSFATCVLVLRKEYKVSYSSYSESTWYSSEGEDGKKKKDTHLRSHLLFLADCRKITQGCWVRRQPQKSVIQPYF